MVHSTLANGDFSQTVGPYITLGFIVFAVAAMAALVLISRKWHQNQSAKPGKGSRPAAVPSNSKAYGRVKVPDRQLASEESPLVRDERKWIDDGLAMIEFELQFAN